MSAATNVSEEPFYEVGWFYEGGSPSEAARKEALEHMLKLYGSDPARWKVLPEIRVEPTVVTSSDFGRGPLIIRKPGWAVYGALRDMPRIGYVPEGVRLPSVETVRFE